MRNGEPCRETEVGGQMGQLNGAIHELDDCVTSIEERLNGVLRSEPPSPIAGTLSKSAEVDRCLVPLADSIRNEVYRINRNIGRIRSMMERLEV